MSFIAISHAFLTNIFTIFDKISVEWFTFGPEVTRNEQEKIRIRSWKIRDFLAKRAKIMIYMTVFLSHPARYVFYDLYGRWLIWPKKADFGAVLQNYDLYGRPYKSLSTVCYEDQTINFARIRVHVFLDYIIFTMIFLITKFTILQSNLYYGFSFRKQIWKQTTVMR